MAPTEGNGPDPIRARTTFLERVGLPDLDPDDLGPALIHRSYANENQLTEDNERLEFLGDAVIGMIASEWLYATLPEAAEGELSKRRAALVSRAALGRRARELGLSDLILLGRGELDSGGRRRNSILGSTLEAVVGVVYRRLGYRAADRFVRRAILEPLREAGVADDYHGDFKSALQEWTQQHHGQTPEYRIIAEEGPDHAKRFAVAVDVAGREQARGEGPRIKVAENEAARLALLKLTDEPPRP